MISNYDLRQFSQVSRLLIIVRGNTSSSTRLRTYVVDVLVL